ncbi:MAG: lipid-A-disaccharide synthase [Hyphomonadaceae bacterium]|nr:lipid-A-disaccharide synthase [Hyphomonadaceae bacterium]
MSHVFLVAAEDSGDAFGADVIDALRAKDPNVRISGIGGERMRDRGAHTDVDMSGLAVLGLVEGLKAYGRVKQAVEDTADAIIKADPDSVVLIDSWGFMWRVARALKLRGARAKRIKLIGPQVWATRPGRARVLSKWVDHLLCIHPFEQPFYVKWGLPTTVIGNPALHRLPKGDAVAFRSRHGIPPDAPVIGLLLGSRKAEMRRVAPTLMEATRIVHMRDPRRHVVCMVAPSVVKEVEALATTQNFPIVLVRNEAEKADAYAAMTVAIACSGTVTTELAAQGAAVVTGYKLGWITWALLRFFLFKSKFSALVNVAADREVIPEFLQTRFNAAKIEQAVELRLSNPAVLRAQQDAQRSALRVMAGNGRPAAEIAAETILKLS